MLNIGKQVEYWWTKQLDQSVEAFLRKVRENGVSVRYGVIFGSQATGRSSDLSDIDLLGGEKQWLEDDSNAIIEIARRDTEKSHPATLSSEKQIPGVSAGPGRRLNTQKGDVSPIFTIFTSIYMLTEKLDYSKVGLPT